MDLDNPQFFWYLNDLSQCYATADLGGGGGDRFYSPQVFNPLATKRFRLGAILWFSFLHYEFYEMIQTVQFFLWVDEMIYYHKFDLLQQSRWKRIELRPDRYEQLISVKLKLYSLKLILDFISWFQYVYRL